jgi:hypothetical protein
MLCDRCEHPLIEIDHYGERLNGCLQCNCWKGDKSAFIVELSVEDFAALRGIKTTPHDDQSSPTNRGDMAPRG